MKLLTVIVFVLGSSLSFSQEWRDSLEVARKAYKNEDFEKALKYYKSAQKKAPDDIDLSDEIGQTAYKSGDYETAEKVFQQNGANKRSKVDKAKNFHNIGNSRMRDENYEGAVDAYKESLKMNPSDERTRYNLSQAQRKLRKQKKDQQDKGGGSDKKDPKNPKDPKDGKPGDKQDGGDKKNGKPGDGQNGNKPEDKKGSKKNGQGDQPQQSGNKSQLPNKAVDRMLDELMKKRGRDQTSNGRKWRWWIHP